MGTEVCSLSGMVVDVSKTEGYNASGGIAGRSRCAGLRQSRETVCR